MIAEEIHNPAFMEVRIVARFVVPASAPDALIDGIGNAILQTAQGCAVANGITLESLMFNGASKLTGVKPTFQQGVAK